MLVISLVTICKASDDIVDIEYGIEKKSQRVCRDITVSNRVHRSCVYEVVAFQNWILMKFKYDSPVTGIEYYYIGVPVGSIELYKGDYF